ncbi:alpha-amylase family glycosyl hydrolase [Flavobacterium sp. W21_SRS_FM6]|uniref:alpha-amylase family glycosyl hydrolase n=1 Tax=Flavobacterium sp. W21_SRS_FM6 TaxID=3240268 RepID=UPI003F91784A
MLPSNLKRHARYFSFIALTLGVTLACTPVNQDSSPEENKASDLARFLPAEPQGKPVVYQVFTRLFGNKNQTNTPWGSIAENGVGKFSDFTDTALQGIKQLGVTHIWYTGVPHHDVITDYVAYGISNDDPDVVKGRAGSPYAVKDYYNVNPDLADDPAQRLAEFEALIKRTHNNGMQVIIDIVPNHVARNYQSLSKPQGVKDFGQDDDTSVTYRRDNNFYYVVGEDFKVPQPLDGYQPLGGQPHSLSDGKFDESPAKWTGNGSRLAQPHFHDWYETVKVNYGVKPDGSYDFPRLPEQYLKLGIADHQAFWADKDVPDSWRKFRDITHYWLQKGVDGFRYDMAEMVPVEFWSYLNSSIKTRNPQAFLLAEVYNPSQYHNYIQLGKMDYLYDKVDFYDTLKAVMQQRQSAQKLHQVQTGIADIEPHMLHFLENHDEQRIPSDDFAGLVGGAQMGKPALVASALISRSPTLIYFGQEVGEDGSEDMGFGKPSRTTIFDYAGVPAHQRWMNNGQFDGGQLSLEERALRDYYIKVLNISAYHPAMLGQYLALPMQASFVYATQKDQAGRLQRLSYEDAARVFAFVRFTPSSSLLVISHFSEQNSVNIRLPLDTKIIENARLGSGQHVVVDLLTAEQYSLNVDGQKTVFNATLAPMQSLVIQLK